MRAQRVDPLELNLFSLTFDGPADTPHEDVVLWNELDLPLETGDAYRAMILHSQEATETFGRQRIQLVKQAPAEAPSHVEANVILAESTPSVDRLIELFQNAKKTAKTRLGSN